MTSIFKKKKVIQVFLNKINPFHTDSLIVKIQRQLFPQKTANSNRKRYLISFCIFLTLNIALYVSTLNDYKIFALNTKKFSVSTELIDLPTISERLSNEYGNDDSPKTLYTYISIISIFGIVIFIEYIAFRKSYQQFGWKPKKLIKSTLTFIAIHTLYFVPIYPLMVSETHAVDSLIEKANQDLTLAIDDIFRSSSSENISYGFDKATVKILLSEKSPYILNGVFEQEVVINFLDIKEADTFYRAIVVPFVVRQEENINIPHNIILFPNNKIAISNKTSISELDMILSVISNKSVIESPLSSHVSSKREPEISLLDESEYNEMENEKLEIKEKQFEAYVNAVLRDINENNKYIKNTKNALLNLKNEKSSYEGRVRPLLNQCISKYGASDCQEPTQIVESAISDYDSEIRQVESYLSEARTYVPLLNREYSLSKNAYDQFLKYPILPELQSGIFEPPNNIFIKYNDGRDGIKINPSNYYYTLMHELIHYYSYSLKDNTPPFIEEGITDLLALQVGGHYANPIEKIDGYPEEIQIASKIFEILGTENATKLFFMKSQGNWQTELDNVCGKGCYKKLEKIGNQLTYTKADDIETRSILLTEALDILQN